MSETKWIQERQYEKRLDHNGTYVIMARGFTHVGLKVTIENLPWTDICIVGRQLSYWSAKDEADRILTALRQMEERRVATVS